MSLNSNTSLAVGDFSSRRFKNGVLVLASCIFLYNIYANRYFYHDDAFISLRYALNFVNYGDLSWNPGDHVEGYTNFLHLLLTASLIKLGIEPISATHIVNGFGVALFLSSLAYGLTYICKTPEARNLGLSAALMSPPLAIWLLGGLESVLTTAFITTAIVTLLPLFSPNSTKHLSPALLSSIFFALAYLTRPDSVIVNFAAGIGVLAFGIATMKTRLAQFFLIGAIPVLVIMIHVFWRLSYYGDLLPNTFYAKIAVDPAIRLLTGSNYVLKTALFSLPAITLSGAIFLIALASHHFDFTSRRIALFFATTLAFHIAYIIWSGGDHMPAGRVVLPVLGIGCLLLGVSITAVIPPMKNATFLIGFALLAVASITSKPQRMNPAAYFGSITGHYINHAWPDDALVALSTAGSTPYFAHSKHYIDMLGLNDRSIGKRAPIPLRLKNQSMPGHAKGDGKYILSREPDYIILGPSLGAQKSDPWFLSDIELAENPEFTACYELITVKLERDITWPKDPGYINDNVVFTYYERTCPITQR